MIQLKLWHKLLISILCFGIATAAFILKLPAAFRHYDKELHSAFYFFASAFLNILFAKRSILIHTFIFGLLYVFGVMIEHSQVLSKKIWHIAHGRYDPEDVQANLRGLIAFSILWLVFTGISIIVSRTKNTKQDNKQNHSIY